MPETDEQIPMPCKDHAHTNIGADACVICQIFNTWVISERKCQITRHEISQLTGVPEIQIRRAESLAEHYERYGAYPLVSNY